MTVRIRPREGKQSFVSRCLSCPTMRGLSPRQRASACYGIWEDSRSPQPEAVPVAGDDSTDTAKSGVPGDGVGGAIAQVQAAGDAGKGGALVPFPADGHSDKHIVKLRRGRYRLYSTKEDPRTGRRRNLGTFPSLAAAKKHEGEVEYFKRNKSATCTEGTGQDGGRAELNRKSELGDDGFTRRDRAGGTFFAQCQRDKQGHCMPGRGGVQGSGAQQKRKAKATGNQPAKPEPYKSFLVRGRELLQGMKDTAERMGEAAFHKLPHKVKVATAYTYVLATKLTNDPEYAKETPNRLGARLVHEITSQEGLSDEQAKKVMHVVKTIDRVGSSDIPLNDSNVFEKVAEAISPAIGPIAGNLPVASLAFVAYSSVTHPVATARAARNVIMRLHEVVLDEEKSLKLERLTMKSRDSGEESQEGSRPMQEWDRETVGLLVEAYKRHEGDEWFEALLYAAIDETHDARQAIKLAEQALDESPEPPAAGVTQKSLTLKDSFYHGPNPPGPGWQPAGQGPKGGKIWRYAGEGGNGAGEKKKRGQ